MNITFYIFYKRFCYKFAFQITLINEFKPKIDYFLALLTYLFFIYGYNENIKYQTVGNCILCYAKF